MKSSNSLPKSVYRHVPIHRLWQILATKRLYFMRNSKWDDPFEGFLVRRYCKTVAKDYASLNSDKFFLCCSINRERDHQWRNYTPNKDGVVVTLNVKALLAANDSILIRPIKYPLRTRIDNLLRKMRSKTFPEHLILELFFIKNFAFEDEKEIRFLLQDATAKNDIVSVEIEIEMVIEAILFDPRMDHPTYEYHKQFIQDQFGISKISHSSLYDPDRRFPR
jgi:hypothetical protein